MLNDGFGIGALIRSGAFLSNLLDLEVMGCGRAGLAPRDSCKLELAGRWLFYDVTLDGGFVFLRIALMDKAEEPELILSVGDRPQNWRVICKLIAALERNQIQSLERSIEAGLGPSGFVIS
jgi:hypothetical protein